MNKLIKNILFIIQTFWIFFSEIILYCFNKDYNLFIARFTKRLASVNILYVKVFQSLALNNNIINHKINNELLRFADDVPFTKDDIDYDTLLAISMEHDIVFKHGFDKPINSGMISLVYLARYRKIETAHESAHETANDNIIIKIKRKNIDKKIEEGIDNLLFLINLLKFIPLFNNYKISETIQNNIDIIKKQTHFDKEIANIKRIKKNCQHINYIKIPQVYDTICNKNVIAMEYINGKRFNEIQEEDYIEFAKQVIKFGIVTSFIHGFTHGDLHVGNILFIKEKKEIDEKPIYKLGIIDFGIITEINEPFKSNLLNCLSSIFQDSSIIFFNKFVNSGIFEPCIIKNVIPANVYSELVEMNIHFVDKLVSRKDLNQNFLYDIIKTFFSFLNKPRNDMYNLSKYGIRPSDDFIKLQLSLAMSNGITFELCKERMFKITNEVVNDLFHTKLFIDE